MYAKFENLIKRENGVITEIKVYSRRFTFNTYKETGVGVRFSKRRRTVKVKGFDH